MCRASWANAYGSVIFLAVSVTPGPAQSSVQQSPGATTASQLPLSGRGGQPGAVIVNQSTTNAGGGNSVDLIQSSINVQGPYSGSAAQGANSGTVLSLTLDQALHLGLRFNLGAISQSQVASQAKGQRRVARSMLLPSVDTVVNETVEQLNLRTAGVLEPSFPLAVGPFNFFDARAASPSSSRKWPRLG